MDTPLYSTRTHVAFSSNQEYRYAFRNSGTCSLSKLARCRRPNMPLLLSLRGLRVPRRLLTIPPTTVRVAIVMRHCSGRQPSKLGLFWKARCTNAKGCLMAKGLRKPISRSTHVLADNKFGRVFVDLSGPKPVKSTGRNGYVTRLSRSDHF